jgi:hypothetical protein
VAVATVVVLQEAKKSIQFKPRQIPEARSNRVFWRIAEILAFFRVMSIHKSKNAVPITALARAISSEGSGMYFENTPTVPNMSIDTINFI